jgi:hypothetical protein
LKINILWQRCGGTGLPVGIFSNRISQFGYILEGFGMEYVVIFSGPLEYITAIWYILGPFGNIVVSWHIFPRFGILYREKSGNPAADAQKSFSRKKIRVEML